MTYNVFGDGTLSLTQSINRCLLWIFSSTIEEPCQFLICKLVSCYPHAAWNVACSCRTQAAWHAWTWSVHALISLVCRRLKCPNSVFYFSRRAFSSPSNFSPHRSVIFQVPHFQCPGESIPLTQGRGRFSTHAANALRAEIDGSTQGSCSLIINSWDCQRWTNTHWYYRFLTFILDIGLYTGLNDRSVWFMQFRDYTPCSEKSDIFVFHIFLAGFWQILWNFQTVA